MNDYYAIVSDDNAEYDHKMMNKQDYIMLFK